ncbi:MAG TPA: hypothetical protein VF892_13315, partial [Pseudonocardiaceae bacterium]
ADLDIDELLAQDDEAEDDEDDIDELVLVDWFEPFAEDDGEEDGSDEDDFDVAEAVDQTVQA